MTTAWARLRTVWWARPALLLLVSLLPRLYYVGTNAFSYDETHNLTFGALSAAGFIPYREVFVGIAPLALLSVQVSASLWLGTPWVRLILLIYGLLGVWAVYELALRHAPQRPFTAAVLATLFFSFNPHFFAVSTTITLEASALAFGLLAVLAMDQATGQAAVSRRALVWAAASGVAFALSLAIKVMVPFVPAVILAQMLLLIHDRGLLRQPGRAVGELVRLGLAWTAGSLAVLAVFTLIYDPALMYRDAIDFRLVLRDAAVAGDGDVNVAEELQWTDALQFLPLVIGAGLSVPVLRRQRPRVLWVWGTWLLMSLAFLTMHVPLRPRHLVTVLPPLTVLSGIGVAAWLDGSRRAVVRWVVVAGAAATLLASGAGAAYLAPTRNFVVTHPSRDAVLDYLHARTAPDDCVVAKENRFYFLSKRLPPPFLSEVSTARLFSGLLTADQVMAEIDRHDCAALVYDDSFDELAPTLAGLVAEYYSVTLKLVAADDEPITVYAVPRTTAPKGHPPPATPLAADLGGLVMFGGFDLTPGPWARGQTVYLSTYWQAQQRIPTDYRIFVHVTDGTGALVDSFDHWPFEARSEFGIADAALHPVYLDGDSLPENYPNAGLIPTHVWQPGQTLKETIALTPDLPPGEYTVQIGLFDPTTGERLDVPDDLDGGVANQLVLTTVEVR